MPSPLDTAFNRLDESHRAFHTALEGYHRLDDFRAGVNTALQSFQNLVYSLEHQKELGSIPDFDKWFDGWKSKMIKSPILRALHTGRVVIVHTEDLVLKSTAIARTKGWVDFEKTSFEFDPTSDSYEFAKGFYEAYAKHLPLPEEGKKRAVFEFERKWVYEKLPDYELLDAVSEAYNFFLLMLRDAEQVFSLPAREIVATGDYCSPEFNNQNKMKCMVVTPQERRLTFSFTDGKQISDGLETRMSDSVSESDLEKARKRYGDFWKSQEVLDLLEGLFPNEYPFDQMKVFTQVALANLKRDKYLVPITVIFGKNKGDTPIPIAHPFQNQEQKVMTMDMIASKIIKSNGKYVLNLSEVWRYAFDEKNPKIPTQRDTKNAKEMLQICYMTADSIKTISIPFTKNLLGNIKYSKPSIVETSSENTKQFIFSGLIKALKQVDSS